MQTFSYIVDSKLYNYPGPPDQYWGPRNKNLKNLQWHILRFIMQTFLYSLVREASFCKKKMFSLECNNIRYLTPNSVEYPFPWILLLLWTKQNDILTINIIYSVLAFINFSLHKQPLNIARQHEKSFQTTTSYVLDLVGHFQSMSLWPIL